MKKLKVKLLLLILTTLVVTACTPNLDKAEHIFISKALPLTSENITITQMTFLEYAEDINKYFNNPDKKSLAFFVWIDNQTDKDINISKKLDIKLIYKNRTYSPKKSDTFTIKGKSTQQAIFAFDVPVEVMNDLSNLQKYMKFGNKEYVFDIVKEQVDLTQELNLELSLITSDLWLSASRLEFDIQDIQWGRVPVSTSREYENKINELKKTFIKDTKKYYEKISDFANTMNKNQIYNNTTKCANDVVDMYTNFKKMKFTIEDEKDFMNKLTILLRRLEHLSNTLN